MNTDDTPKTNLALWDTKENNCDDGEIDWCYVAVDMVTHSRELERENNKLKRVEELARAAVEAGAVEECYLSLLRDALK